MLTAVCCFHVFRICRHVMHASSDLNRVLRSKVHSRSVAIPGARHALVVVPANADTWNLGRLCNKRWHKEQGERVADFAWDLLHAFFHADDRHDIPARVAVLAAEEQGRGVGEEGTVQALPRVSGYCRQGHCCAQEASSKGCKTTGRELGRRLCGRHVEAVADRVGGAVPPTVDWHQRHHDVRKSHFVLFVCFTSAK